MEDKREKLKNLCMSFKRKIQVILLKALRNVDFDNQIINSFTNHDI